MKKQPWIAMEESILRDLYPDVPTMDIAELLGRTLGSVYQHAAAIGLHKSAAFLASDMAARIRPGKQLPAMIESRFKPGMTPWNKGIPFISGGRSSETQFKKGERSGAAKQNWVPVGTYRLNRDGLLDQKITDQGLGTRDWIAVHRLVWITANGPIPKNHIVVFRPGRRTNLLARITHDALECISLVENARRNHPSRKSPELAKLVQLKGAITRQVNRINREHKEGNQHDNNQRHPAHEPIAPTPVGHAGRSSQQE